MFFVAAWKVQSEKSFINELKIQIMYIKEHKKRQSRLFFVLFFFLLINNIS